MDDFDRAIELITKAKHETAYEIVSTLREVRRLRATLDQVAALAWSDVFVNQNLSVLKDLRRLVPRYPVAEPESEPEVFVGGRDRTSREESRGQ